jgi:hypothetical protein
MTTPLKNTNLTLIFLALASTSAVAHDSYNFDIQYNHRTIEFETNQGVQSFWSKKTESSDWDFNYYFNDVDIERGPLNEAAFINRASKVGFVLGGNNDYADIEYYGRDHDFYFRMQYGDFEGSKFDLGWMVQDNWLIALTSARGATETEVGLYSKRLITLNNGDMLNFELGYDGANYSTAYGEDVGQYYIGADYYLDRDLSVGVTLSNNKRDEPGAERFIGYEARIDWFAFDGLSFGFSYQGNTADTLHNPHGSNGDIDIDHTYNATMNFRF